MFAVLPMIAAGIASAFSLLLRHPLIAKMLTFSFFIALIAYAISFLKSLVMPYIVGNSLMAVASYMGVLDGLNIYIMIILAGFGTKQVLAFLRS